MTHFIRRVLTLAIATTMLVAFAACGDDAVPTSTEPITFSEGSIPDSVPDDFPIPDGAVIGTTMVDRVNNRTEFRITWRTDPTSAVQFFELGLVNRGYVVESSEGNQALWTLTFANGELTGQIVFSAPQNDLVAAVVSLATS
jgi:hypothetical protein